MVDQNYIHRRLFQTRRTKVKGDSANIPAMPPIVNFGQNDPLYARYWTHYQYVSDWMQKHRRITGVVFASGSNFSEVQHGNCFAGNKLLSNEVFESTEECNFEDNMEDNDAEADPLDSQTEFELSPELIDFFRQTVLHRKQRDEQKAAELAGKSAESWFLDQPDDYIPADQVGISGPREREATTDAPSEQVGLVRRREYEKLYGSKAERILALEASAQSRFDSVYFSVNPAMWPNIPLKF